MAANLLRKGWKDFNRKEPALNELKGRKERKENQESFAPFAFFAVKKSQAE